MDKRTEKTKHKIHTAFLKLAPQGEDIFRISVMDIAKEAGISRSTFYSHYTDISELALSISRQLTDEFAVIADKTLAQNSSVSELFYQALYFVRNLQPVEAQLFLNYCPSPFSERYANRIPGTVAAASRRQVCLFFISGLCGLMLDWKNNGCKQSVEEMVHIMEESTATCEHLS